MDAIDFCPNGKAQSMFVHRKATKLLCKAKEVAHVAHPRMIASPTFRCSAAYVSRTMVTTGKEGAAVDPCELEAIFEQKRSLRSKVRKALKNMDPIQRSQEDNAIRNIVLESSWFKASKILCAYISSPALHEADTSRIISEVLSSPAKGFFFFFLEGVGDSRITLYELIDLGDFISFFFCNFQERKKLYVPRVEDRNSNMKMLMISSVNDLTEKSMNILEPALVDSEGNEREDGMISPFLTS
ncbi:hypothetical protein DITRI_Ditri17bG0053700 [Diplodiscus trichospermus]